MLKLILPVSICLFHFSFLMTIRKFKIKYMAHLLYFYWTVLGTI